MRDEPSRRFGHQVRQLLRQSLPINGLAVLIGIAAGLAAVLFRWFLFGVNNLFFHQELTLGFIPPLDHGLGWVVILVPAAGGLLVGLITTYLAPETKGHGVPEAMEAIAMHGGRIRPIVVLAKALASAFCIGTGGSSGREGPIVQMGSASGSALGQLFGLSSRDVKVLVGCGAAAGITATFNTPLAGVVFAIELILLEFRTKSFVPLVIASVVATVISRLVFGSEPAFAIPAYAFAHPVELVFYLFLGLLASGVGVLLIETLYGMEDLFDRWKAHPVIKPIAGGLGLGVIGLAFPEVFGVGYESVDAILSRNIGEAGLGLVVSLVVLAGVKTLALSLTLGSGGSGGVFAPSLFIGAALGGAFGVLVNLMFPEVTAPYPAYALVGMAALFSAASRATFTSILMLFEMTGDYNIILPLMFACVVADVVAWHLYSDTIYTKKLERRGVHVEHDLEVNVMRTRFVRDVMITDVQTVPSWMTLRHVRRRILESGHHGFPVVSDSNKLVGIVTGQDINDAIRTRRNGRDLPVKEVAHRDLVVGYPDETLDTVWERMRTNGVGHLPVVDREDNRRLVGYLTKGDLIGGRT
ncbi:MAG: chloride channel protein [Candidatus Bipolaricaulia bacterium]